MSTPTQNCDECEHFAFYDGPNCAKGHNPRFYKPTIAVDVKAWGYKRKCEDFESMKEKETMSTPFKGKHMNRDAFRKELLLTKAIELFNDYDAGEMTSVISWMMGLHVRYVVDRGIMTEDEALGAMLSMVRAAYTAQGEKNT